MRRPLFGLLIVTVTASLVAGAPGSAVEPSAEIAPATSPVGRPEAAPARRIVWDAARSGVDIRTASIDGTDETRLFHQRRGYVANLTLSRDGRQVAFVPYRQGRPARLVVAQTNGDGWVDLLAGHQGLADVGPLAWSADGSRIVFEGAVDEESAGSFYPTYLFTIDTDGTDLHRHQRLDDGKENGAVFGAMAWTPHGIVYPDDHRVVLLRGDQRRTLALNASDVAPSGNNRWIFFRRPMRPPNYSQVLWRVRPDGTDLQRVASSNARLGELLAASPNFRGTRILARRTTDSGSQLISFAVSAPRRVREMPVRGYVATAVWR